MFRRVQALHYKILKNVDVPLENFNILIGLNASGKSTLLDIFAFLQDALLNDVDHAVRARGRNLRELVWQQQDVEQGFEFAIEADIPSHMQGTDSEYDRVRYELAIQFDAVVGIKISAENLFFGDSHRPRRDSRQIAMRPGRKTLAGYRKIISKSAAGSDNYHSERSDWKIQYRLPTFRLSLSGVPEDESKFPVTMWFRRTLLENIQILKLNSSAMQRPTPFDAPRTFQADGSNLPVMIDILKKDPTRFTWWLGHIQTILEDVEDVVVEERPEDNASYLSVIYQGGLRVPAWLLSDGTLRLLALTLLAYLPSQGQVFMIEEPENGVHPRVIESLFKSLSSVYDGQVFIATHSPLLLGLAQPEQLLVFSKNSEGYAEVIPGPQHPYLQEWQGEIDLATLFASGILESI